MNTINSVIKKIKYLFNNIRKKFAAALVFLMLVLSQGDMSVFFLKIPDFEQLIVSEGIIKIDGWQLRIGNQLNLLINKQKIPFSCWISGGDNSCIPSKYISDYQGKTGKVWWYRTSYFGWAKDNRLYQLEVDGKAVITYQNQIKRYLSMRSGYPYLFTILFIISLIWFFLLQFANDQSTPNKE